MLDGFSKPALIAAGTYFVLSALLIFLPSGSSGGNWISLPTLVPWLLTFPLSLPLEMLGMLPDLNRPANVFLMLFLCAALIYWLTEFIVKLFSR